MPVYVYECTACGKRFEFFQHFTDDPITVCPECKQPTLRNYPAKQAHPSNKSNYP